jgi:arylsulfatase A
MLFKGALMFPSRTTRREFAALAGGCLASAVLNAQSDRSRQRPPNILMILCDDLGYSDLGCYGNRIIQTPHLDQLARRGTRFTDFYSIAPVCTPARAALMTGKYPQRFGIHHADLPESLPRYPLPPSALTVSEVLQSSGYYTAHIGKWHLGEPPEMPEPRKRGFHYFFGSFGGRPSSPWNKYARSMDPEIIENEDRPRVMKGHVTDVQTDGALATLSRLRRDQPFFMNLWYNAPHEPLAPLKHQAELYKDWSSAEQTYFQTVTDMDRGVGRILAKLEELGLAGNTLIFFSSDNGPEAHRSQYARGSAWPLKGMKTQLWEGGIRVPGILVWPGKVPAGATCRVPSSLLDLFPTFTAAAGVTPPSGWVTDGDLDLVSAANRVPVQPDRPIFAEFHFVQRGVAPSLPVAVRRGDWKLFTNHEFSQVQLYDLRHDIGEQRDVATEHPEVTRRLIADVKTWWSDVGQGQSLSRTITRVETPSLEELDKRHYRN